MSVDSDFHPQRASTPSSPLRIFTHITCIHYIYIYMDFTYIYIFLCVYIFYIIYVYFFCMYIYLSLFVCVEYRRTDGVLTTPHPETRRTNVASNRGRYCYCHNTQRHATFSLLYRNELCPVTFQFTLYNQFSLRSFNSLFLSSGNYLRCFNSTLTCRPINIT